jgi:hypothetical protein
MPIKLQYQFPLFYQPAHARSHEFNPTHIGTHCDAPSCAAQHKAPTTVKLVLALSRLAEKQEKSWIKKHLKSNSTNYPHQAG